MVAVEGLGGGWVLLLMLVSFFFLRNLKKKLDRQCRGGKRFPPPRKILGRYPKDTRKILDARGVHPQSHGRTFGRICQKRYAKDTQKMRAKILERYPVFHPMKSVINGKDFGKHDVKRFFDDLRKFEKDTRKMFKRYSKRYFEYLLKKKTTDDDSVNVQKSRKRYAKNTPKILDRYCYSKTTVQKITKKDTRSDKRKKNEI